MKPFWNIWYAALSFLIVVVAFLLFIGIFVIMALATNAAPANAQAATFDAIARQCQAEAEKQCEGANCLGRWPAVAHCAITRAYGDRVSLKRISECSQAVFQRRWEHDVSQQYGNPVLDTARCALGMAF